MATNNDENTNGLNKKYQILIDTASKKEIELAKGRAPSAYLYDATLSTDEGKSWHHVFIDPFRARQSVVVKASPDHRTIKPESIDDLSYAGEVRQIKSGAALSDSTIRQNNQDKVDNAVTKFLFLLERGEAVNAGKQALRAFKMIQETGLTMDPRMNMDVPVIEKAGPRVAALKREAESKGLER